MPGDRSLLRLLGAVYLRKEDNEQLGHIALAFRVFASPSLRDSLRRVSVTTGHSHGSPRGTKQNNNN